MLKAVSSYIKNVGKSIAYSSTDVVSENMQSTSNFIDTNKELFKEIYSSVRNLKATSRRVNSQMKNSKIFEAADVGIKSVFQDLKTGNFYNKKRMDEATTKYSGDLFSENDDFNISMGGNEDEGEAEYQPSAGEKLVSSSITKSNQLNAEMISDVLIRTTNASMQNQRAASNASFAQNVEIIGNVKSAVQSLIGTNNNIGNLISVSQVQAQNSKAYYETATKYMNETSAILKEMLEMQRNLYKSQAVAQNTKSNNRQDRYSDMVNSTGGIDLKKYIGAVKGNARGMLEDAGLGMLFGGGDDGMNLLAQMASSPLQFIPKMMIQSMMGKQLPKAMKNFDNTISGVFASTLARLGDWKDNSDDPIKKLLGDLFGVKISNKDKLNSSKFNKGAVPFDGITKKAITDVIPAYLRRIEAALTGRSELIYDMNSGKWTNAKELKKSWDQMKQSSIYSAFSDVEDFKRQVQSSVKYKNIDEQKKFTEEMKVLLESLYNKNGNFMPILRANKDNARDVAMDYNVSEETLRTMQAILKNMPRNELSQIERKTLEAKSSRTNMLEAMEKNGSIYTTLFEGLDFDQHLDKKTGTMTSKTSNTASLLKTTDQYGKNMFDYMQLVVKEQGWLRAYISANGLGGGGFGIGRRPRIPNIKDMTIDGKRIKNEQEREVDKEAAERLRYSRDVERFEQYGGYTLNGTTDENIRRINAVANVTKSENEAYDRIEKSKPTFMQDLFGVDPDKPKKQYKSTKLMDKLLEAESVFDKYEVIKSGFEDLAKKPAAMLTGIIEKADKHIYDFMYGADTDERDANGKPIKGFMQKMVSEISKTFNNLNKWLNESVITPLKEKLGIETPEDILRKAFRAFGADYDQTKVKIKTSLSSAAKPFRDAFKRNFNAVKDETGNAIRTTYGAASDRFFGTRFNQSSLPGVPTMTPEQLAAQTVQAMANGTVEGGVAGVTKQDITTVLSGGEVVIGPDGRAAVVKGKKPVLTKAKAGTMIINPADKKTREKQLEKEKAYRDSIYQGMQKTIRVNANVDEIADKDIKSDKIDADAIKYEKYLQGVKINLNSDANDLFGPQLAEVAPEQRDGIQEGINKAINWFDDNKAGVADTTAKGAIGGGIGLLFGGPILGAAVGIATGLAKNSSKFNKYLFGSEDADDGLISKQTQETVKAAWPNIKKYGIAGALGGFLTLGSFTGMGPFGLLAGAATGAGLALMKNSSDFQDMLFGEADENGVRVKKEAFEKKVREVAPKAGVGAAAGAVASMFMGPGVGLMTGALLGSGVGLLSTTDEFKNVVFGEPDENGVRTGGLVNAFKENVIEPLKQFAIDVKDNLKDFFKTKILEPIGSAIKPIVTEIGHVTKSVLMFIPNTVNNIMEKSLGVPLDVFVKEKILDPIGKLTSKIFGFIMKPVKAIISAPAKLVGAIGNRLRAKQIRQGRADYMTAQERMDYRTTHNVNGIFSKDKYAETDNVIAGLDAETTDDLLTAMRLDKEGEKFIDKDIMRAKTGVVRKVNEQFRDGMFTGQRKLILKAINAGDIAKAEKLISTLKNRDGRKLTEEERAQFIEVLRPLEEQLQTAKLSKEKFESLKGKSSEVLAKHGITAYDGTSKNTNKLIGYLQNQKSFLRKEELERKTLGQPETVQNELVTSIDNSALRTDTQQMVELLKIIAGERDIRGRRVSTSKKFMKNTDDPRIAQLEKIGAVKRDGDRVEIVDHTSYANYMGDNGGYDVNEEYGFDQVASATGAQAAVKLDIGSGDVSGIKNQFAKAVQNTTKDYTKNITKTHNKANSSNKGISKANIKAAEKTLKRLTTRTLYTKDDFANVQFEALLPRAQGIVNKSISNGTKINIEILNTLSGKQLDKVDQMIKHSSLDTKEKIDILLRMTPLEIKRFIKFAIPAGIEFDVPFITSQFFYYALNYNRDLSDKAKKIVYEFLGKMLNKGMLYKLSLRDVQSLTLVNMIKLTKQPGKLRDILEGRDETTSKIIDFSHDYDTMEAEPGLEPIALNAHADQGTDQISNFSGHGYDVDNFDLSKLASIDNIDLGKFARVEDFSTNTNASIENFNTNTNASLDTALINIESQSANLLGNINSEIRSSNQLTQAWMQNDANQWKTNNGTLQQYLNANNQILRDSFMVDAPSRRKDKKKKKTIKLNNGKVSGFDAVSETVEEGMSSVDKSVDKVADILTRAPWQKKLALFGKSIKHALIGVGVPLLAWAIPKVLWPMIKDKAMPAIDKAIFGEKNEDGKKEGGLMGVIKGWWTDHAVPGIKNVFYGEDGKGGLIGTVKTWWNETAIPALIGTDPDKDGNFEGGIFSKPFNWMNTNIKPHIIKTANFLKDGFNLIKDFFTNKDHQSDTFGSLQFSAEDQGFSGILPTFAKTILNGIEWGLSEGIPMLGQMLVEKLPSLLMSAGIGIGRLFGLDIKDSGLSVGNANVKREGDYLNADGTLYKNSAGLTVDPANIAHMSPEEIAYLNNLNTYSWKDQSQYAANLNALNNGAGNTYSGDNYKNKTFGNRFGDSLVRTAVTGRIPGVATALNKGGQAVSKFLGKIPGLGWAAKGVGGIAQGMDAVYSAVAGGANAVKQQGMKFMANASDLAYNSMSKQAQGVLGDTLSNANAFDNINWNINDGIDDMMSSNPFDDIAETVGKSSDDVSRLVVNSSDDVGRAMMKNAASNSNMFSSAAETLAKNGDEIAEHVGKNKGIVQKVINFVVDGIKGLIGSGPVKAAIEAVKNGPLTKPIINAFKTFGEKIGKAVGKAAATAGGKALGKVATALTTGGLSQALFSLADFVGGYDNAANIMGIATQPTLMERLVAGLVNAITGFFTFGLLPADMIIDFLVDIVLPVINADMVADIKQRRSDAEAILAEYNEANQTELSLEEYNAKVNPTSGQKVQNAFSDAVNGKFTTNFKAFDMSGSPEAINNNATILMDNLFEAVTFIPKALVFGVRKIGDFFVDLFKSFPTAIGLVGDAIGSQFKTTWDSGSFFAGFGAAYGAMDNCDSEFAGNTAKVVFAMTQVVIAPIAMIVSSIAKVKNIVNEVIRGVAEAAPKVLDTIGNTFKIAWDTGNPLAAYGYMAPGITEGDTALGPMMAVAASVIGKIVLSPAINLTLAMGAVKNIVLEILKGAAEAGPKVTDTILGSFKTAWDTGNPVEAIFYTAPGLSEGDTALGPVMAVAASVVGKIVLSGPIMITAAVGAVKNIVLEILKGAAEVGPKVTDTILGSFKTAWDSGNFGEAILYTAPGLAEGDTALGPMLGIAASVVGKIVLSVPIMITAAVGAVKNIVIDIIEGVSEGYPKVYQTINGVFATAWETGDVVQAFSYTADGVGEGETKLGPMISTVGSVIGKIGLALPIVITCAVGAVKNLVIDIIDGVSEAAPKILNTITGTFKTAWETGNAFQAYAYMAPGISEGDTKLGPMIAMVGSIVGKILLAPAINITATVGAVKNLVIDIIDGVSEAGPKVLDTIGGSLATAWETGDMIQAFGYTAPGLNENDTKLGGMIATAGSIIGKILLSPAIIVTSIVGNIKNIVIDIIEGVAAAGPNIVDTIGGAISTAWETGDMFQAFNYVPESYDEDDTTLGPAITVVGSILGKILLSPVIVVTSIVGTVKNFIVSIIDEIGEFDKDKERDQKIIDKAYSGEIDPWGAEYWKDANEGQNEGYLGGLRKINSGFNKFFNAIGATVANLIPKEVRDAIDGAISGIKGFFDGIGDFIQGIFGWFTGNSDVKDEYDQYLNDDGTTKAEESLYGIGKSRRYGRGKGKKTPDHIDQRSFDGRYNAPGDSQFQTIADSGCGPVAAATVLNKYGKGKVEDAANYALQNNYKERNGGTDPKFFNSYLGEHGIDTSYESDPNRIKSNLASGRPVILMGQDRADSGYTPYSSYSPHYVVATGLDRYGNMTVEDPDSRTGGDVYNANHVLRNSSIAITTGRGSRQSKSRYGRSRRSHNNTHFKSVYGKASTRKDFNPYARNIKYGRGLDNIDYDANYDNYKYSYQNLTSYSTPSESELIAMFRLWTSPGNEFYDNADKYAKWTKEASEQSGLDPRYLIAHMMSETGFGTGTLFKTKNNYFGISAYNGTELRDGTSFSDKKAGLIQGALWIKQHYIDNGQVTIYDFVHKVEGNCYACASKTEGYSYAVPNNYWIFTAGEKLKSLNAISKNTKISYVQPDYESAFGSKYVSNFPGIQDSATPKPSKNNTEKSSVIATASGVLEAGANVISSLTSTAKKILKKLYPGAYAILFGEDDRTTSDTYNGDVSNINATDATDWFTETLGSHVSFEYAANQNNIPVSDGHGGITTLDGYHKGIDFANGYEGHDIMSPVSGTVITATDNGGTAGSYVEVEDDHGFIHRFLHQQRGSLNVEVGKRVERGTVLGKVGSTGIGTGAHLHYQINDKNKSATGDLGQSINPDTEYPYWGDYISTEILNNSYDEEISKLEAEYDKLTSIPPNQRDINTINKIKEIENKISEYKVKIDDTKKSGVRSILSDMNSYIANTSYEDYIKDLNNDNIGDGYATAGEYIQKLKDAVYEYGNKYDPSEIAQEITNSKVLDKFMGYDIDYIAPKILDYNAKKTNNDKLTSKTSYLTASSMSDMAASIESLKNNFIDRYGMTYDEGKIRNAIYANSNNYNDDDYKFAAEEAKWNQSQYDVSYGRDFNQIGIENKNRAIQTLVRLASNIAPGLEGAKLLKSLNFAKDNPNIITVKRALDSPRFKSQMNEDNLSNKIDMNDPAEYYANSASLGFLQNDIPEYDINKGIFSNIKSLSYLYDAIKSMHYGTPPLSTMYIRNLSRSISPFIGGLTNTDLTKVMTDSEIGNAATISSSGTPIEFCYNKEKSDELYKKYSELVPSYSNNKSVIYDRFKTLTDNDGTSLLDFDDSYPYIGEYGIDSDDSIYGKGKKFIRPEYSTINTAVPSRQLPRKYQPSPLTKAMNMAAVINDTALSAHGGDNERRTSYSRRRSIPKLNNINRTVTSGMARPQYGLGKIETRKMPSLKINNNSYNMGTSNPTMISNNTYNNGIDYTTLITAILTILGTIATNTGKLNAVVDLLKQNASMLKIDTSKLDKSSGTGSSNSDTLNGIKDAIAKSGLMAQNAAKLALKNTMPSADTKTQELFNAVIQLVRE